MAGESSSKGCLSAKHFDALWARMADMFGHKWVSSYGLDPSPTWQEGLADLSVEEVKSGLTALKGWVEEWPPTLPQFRSLCRPHGCHLAHEFRVPLPEPVSSFSARQAAVAREIAVLRGGVLRPVVEMRRTLTEAEQALLERLDWERIHAAGSDPVRWATMPRVESLQVEVTEPGCTCVLVQKGPMEWSAEGGPCPYCRDWQSRLARVGAGHERPSARRAA